MNDLTGQNLGNYRLTHLIGRGGCADVYLSEHIHLKAAAAVKVLRIQLGDNDQTSFLAEARTLASLVHPGIVRLLDCGIERDMSFLVMAYAPNGTLRVTHPRGSIVPVVSVVSYITQLASALQYAHDHNLIHRDIKPENMLLGEHNEVMLSDFGIALLSSSSSSTRTRAVAGTWAYIAPEQVMGKPKQASDQYALGVVAYEWLCGQCPFQGTFSELCAQHLYAPVPSLQARNPQIPQEMDRVILTALAKNAQDRFATVETFARALAQSSSLSHPSNVSTVVPHPEQDSQWHIPTFLSPSAQQAHDDQQDIATLLKSPITPSPATPLPVTLSSATPSPVTPLPMMSDQSQSDSTPSYPPYQQPVFVNIPSSPALPTQKRASRWPIVLPICICLTIIIAAYIIINLNAWVEHPNTSTTGVAPSTKNAFVQQATSANIQGNLTIIDNVWTNNQPSAIVMVTQNWNPGGGTGTYNNHPVGVQYTGSRWAIFNEDQAPMTPQAFFNVIVLSQSSSVFVQVATPQNTGDDFTVIDNPLTNGNPQAIVMVTQNWNPGGNNGTYNNHPVGVWYTRSGQWSIFNEDYTPMTPQVSFNVQIVSPSSSAFVHQATSSNVGDDYTVFNNSATDGNANAIVLVTQNWNPGGSGNIYNNHEVGVWYTRTGNWSIFNEDYAPMTLQASFNIEIIQT